MEQHSLLLSELINERNLNGRLQIRSFQLIDPILRAAPPPNRPPCPCTPPMSIHPATDHVVNHEMPEYRYANFEGDGKGDIVEYTKTGRHVCDLAFRKGM